MITELFFNIIFNAIDVLIAIIPNPAFLNNVLGSMSGLVELMSLSSFFIPWTTVLLCVSTAIAFYNFQFVLSVVNFIIRKIPGVS